MDAPWRLARSVLAWPVDTQQGSRRNAMIASTALTERRRELDEVEDFLAARTPVTGPARNPLNNGTSGTDEDAEARRGVI